MATSKLPCIVRPKAMRPTVTAQTGLFSVSATRARSTLLPIARANSETASPLTSLASLPSTCDEDAELREVAAVEADLLGNFGFQYRSSAPLVGDRTSADFRPRRSLGTQRCSWQNDDERVPPRPSNAMVKDSCFNEQEGSTDTDTESSDGVNGSLVPCCSVPTLPLLARSASSIA